MQPSSAPTLADRFQGCLLGLAVGDALGARFEGQPGAFICRRYPTVASLIEHPPNDELWYTDDTQMAIGVAETLAAHGEIVEARLCEAFVANYVPDRGYGPGARTVIEAMEAGEDYQRIAASFFPGGSFGNGAAMRVAPVGLFFREDQARLWEQARRSALPTHTHPLGIEGAQLLALAVSLCSQSSAFDHGAFFDRLLEAVVSDEYRQEMKLASKVETARDLVRLGNGIEALASVPTAIACFAHAPDSYPDVIAQAIFLGGDTDTIAAMAGALSGAYLGLQAIPPHLLAVLEDQVQGRSYLHALARRLFDARRP